MASPQDDSAHLATVLDQHVQNAKNTAVNYKSALMVLEEEYSLLRSRQRKLSASRWCITITQRLRALVDNTIVWRLGAALIVSTFFGGVLIVTTRSVIMGLGFGATVFAGSWLLLFRPPDSELAGRLADNESRLSEATGKLKSLHEKIELMKKSLTGAETELQEAIHSSIYRRSRFLKFNWRAMRGEEFEAFLEAVFLELGYSVALTAKTGDQGVDLILGRSGQRIAVQAKAYLNSVSNSAVQEVHSGKSFYGCHAAAVITNSRFTSSAQALASSVGCLLIGEDEIPDLIMGRIDLWAIFFGRN